MKKYAILTFDYEVFMGRETGTVDNCVIRSTREILSILEKNHARAIFFVDAPWLLFLKENSSADFQKVTDQLREIASSGSTVELHIHPQWINAKLYEGKVQFTSFENYRLHSLERDQIVSIFKRSAEILEGITGRKVKCFRAGGWCIEPFHKIKEAFELEGIKFDFSVVPGIKINEGKNYDIDFTSAPALQFYRFTDEVLKDENSGKFIEFPLSTYRGNALVSIFNKALLVLRKDRIYGDGRGLKEKTTKNKLARLFSFSWNILTIDKTHSFVFRNLLRFCFRKKQLLVIVSHPKTISHQALINLNFISTNFTTLNGNDLDSFLINHLLK
jgi:hypothetical protein